jgi:hypothetical protein
VTSFEIVFKLKCICVLHISHSKDSDNTLIAEESTSCQKAKQKYKKSEPVSFSWEFLLFYLLLYADYSGFHFQTNTAPCSRFIYCKCLDLFGMLPFTPVTPIPKSLPESCRWFLNSVGKNWNSPATCHRGTFWERRYSSYSLTTSALHEGESSASWPGHALPSGKGPPVPTGQEAGWAPELVWTQRLEEKSFAPARDWISIARSSIP